MTADLFEGHRAIVAAAEALLAAAREMPRPRMEELSQMRVRLSSLARDHLLAEDNWIVAPLMASGRIDELPGAAALIAEIREGRGQYSDHIRHWTPQAIQANWDGYIDAIAALLVYLKGLIAREERLLYWPALRLLTPAAHEAEPASGSGLTG